MASYRFVVPNAVKWFADHLAGFLVLSGTGALLATLIGFWSSLEPPWDYTFAYGVAALVAAAVVVYLRRHGWHLPPPWGKPYKPGLSRGAYGVAITPGDFPIVRFDLRGQMNQRVPIGHPVRAIEFLEPTHRIIDDPPEPVRWRFRTIAVVKSFTSDALILDSYVQGISARIQVYPEENDS